MNLFKVIDRNNSGVVRLNQIMLKLPIFSEFLQLNYLQIEQLLEFNVMAMPNIF